MDISDEMLQAAVGKAIGAGLLPRNAWREDAERSKELMRPIVQAALAAPPVLFARRPLQPGTFCDPLRPLKTR